MPTEPSQCDLILDALHAANGEWVAMPHLAQVSGSLNIHTRVDQLRHERGLRIENKTERRPECRRQFSYYRIPC